mmetsp:Transcript_11083/g.19506  ORF Transcript_11083/g.19506 Transcript_11083/m.19506 type:complete len:85 (+) Transcript_11083:68-322(+)
MMSQQWESKITIDVMVRTLLSRYPSSRVNVGMDSRYGLILYSMFPAWLRNIFSQLLLPDQTPAALRDAINQKSKNPSGDSKKNE